MYRNKPGQKIVLRAFDYSTGAPKTADAANITAYVSIDGGAATALVDASATEVSSANAPGDYSFDLTQWETRGSELRFTGKSSTANVRIEARTVEAAMEPGKPYSRPDCLFWIEPRLGGLYKESVPVTPATIAADVVKFAPDWSANATYALGTDATVTNAANPFTINTTTVNNVLTLTEAASAGGLTLGNPTAFNLSANAAMTRYYVYRTPASFPAATLYPLLYKGGGTDNRIDDFVVSGSFTRFPGPSTLRTDLAVSTNYIFSVVQVPGEGVERIYVNGQLKAEMRSNFFPSMDTASNWVIGSKSGDFFFAGHLGAAGVFTTAHDDSTREAIEGYLAAGFKLTAGRGLNGNKDVAGAGKVNVLCLGDSITSGQGGGGGTWPNLAVAGWFPAGSRPWTNVGVSGSLATALAAAGTTYAAYFDRGALNVAILFTGSNDLAQNDSAATTYTRIQTAAASLRAAGWKVIVCTILSRGGILTLGQTIAGFEASRQTVNTNLRTNWRSFADGFADFGGSTTITVNGVSIDVSAIGAPTAYSSTTYFGDAVHPVYAGNLILGHVAAEAVTAIARRKSVYSPAYSKSTISGLGV